MISKIGKQLTNTNFENFNVITGTVDNKRPKSLYINISSWVKPNIKGDFNYKKIIKNLNKKVKNKIYSNLNDNLFVSNKNIIDFDIRESGVSFNKKSYMSCEITLFQVNSFKIQEKLIQEKLNELVNILIKEVFDEDIYFSYHKTK